MGRETKAHHHDLCRVQRALDIGTQAGAREGDVKVLSTIGKVGGETNRLGTGLGVVVGEEPLDTPFGGVLRIDCHKKIRGGRADDGSKTHR